jgi:hypothetical protein
MGQTIGITARKGGVGKTTLACLLAYLAAVRHRRRTLLVDMDVDQADSSTWMLRGQVKRDALESGVVYPTKYPYLSVVWVTELGEIPSLSEYAVVVIDGRPSGSVAGAVLGLSDVVIIPYCDATGHAHAVRLAHLSNVPTLLLHNAILRSTVKSGVKGNARRVGYSKALKSKQWGAYKRDLYAEVTAQLAQARRAV